MDCVIFGAGNIAHNLSFTLVKNKHKILQIVGQSESSTKYLANKLGINYTTKINGINNNADLYFLAVNDSSIKKVVSSSEFGDKLVVHLSGSISISIFKNKIKNYGVFYPLQTFSKHKLLDFSEIPICIEANNLKNYKILENIANGISNNVLKINSDQRKILHLSAVFASNFVNQMYSISNDILSEHKLDWSILKPLIKETAQKVMENSAHDSQTGPAKRKDLNIINGHLNLLSKNPSLKHIYEVMSNFIMDYHK